MASVLVSPHRLTDLWQLLAAPDLRSDIQSEVKRLERSLLAGTGLSYQEDLRPWLGEEAAFALTTADLDQVSENGLQPGYLWVLSCRDRRLAQETLDVYWQQRAISGSSLVFEQFAGSQLISARPVDAGPGNVDVLSGAPPSVDAPQLIEASAIIGGQFVLLANSAAVIKQALTAAQSPVSLSRDPGFQVALDRLPKQRIGVIAVNVPQSLAWLGLSDRPRLLTTGLGDADDLFERAVFSLDLNRQGIVANAALLAAPGHTFTTYSSRTGSLDSDQVLPAETSLAAIGHNLSALGSAVSRLLDHYGLAMPPLPPSLALDQALPLDWLATDYALGLVEAPNQTPGWALAVRATSHMEQALADLDQIAHQRGLSVGSLDIDHHSLVAWSKLTVIKARSRDRYPLQVKTEIAGLRTQVGDYELLSPSITAMDQLLQSSESSPKLIDTPLWKGATAPLGQPNRGYLYANWAQVLPSLRQQFPWLRLVETATQPLLHHLKAIAITGYDSSDQIRSGALSLYLSNREAL